MRVIVDLVDTVTSTFTRSIRMLVIGGIIVVAIFALVIGFATPKVVEEVGERAERISAKAIDAAREEQRNHALAQEGWGYSDAASEPADASAAGFDETSDYESDYESGEDWGTSAE